MEVHNGVTREMEVRNESHTRNGSAQWGQVIKAEMELKNETKINLVHEIICVWLRSSFAEAQVQDQEDHLSFRWRVHRNENRVWTLLDQFKAQEGLAERAVVNSKVSYVPNFINKKVLC